MSKQAEWMIRGACVALKIGPSDSTIAKLAELADNEERAIKAIDAMRTAQPYGRVFAAFDYLRATTDTMAKSKSDTVPAPPPEVDW
jgi:hypothetical protein